MIFTPMLSAPAVNNKYFIHVSKGGKNDCILIDKKTGSVLPNCVGFCFGRAYMAWGVKPKLSRGNAENWFGYNDGYKRGKTPKIGAIACWRKGKAGYSADGAGHVAFVEKVNADGSAVVSNSNYSGTRFFTKTISPKDGWNIGTGLTFQGFIYPPVTLTPANPKSKITLSNADYPVSMKQGKYFTIRGKLTSALVMSQVVVGIMDKNDKYLFKFTAKPKTKTFDVHKADNAMMFRKLKRGTYKYKIIALDLNGAHVVIDKTFVVK